MKITTISVCLANKSELFCKYFILFNKRLLPMKFEMQLFCTKIKQISCSYVKWYSVKILPSKTLSSK